MALAPERSAAAELNGLLAAMRPKLYRYCARMVGSVIDGEDVLQDALIKAVESHASAGPIGNPEGWLFRIAHNTALDFLRRRNRQEALRSGEEVDMIADPADTVLSRQIASASLRTFMRLPVAQRASVILMDVLGCSLQEICEVMDFSLPAVKAALHRGRTHPRFPPRVLHYRWRRISHLMNGERRTEMTTNEVPHPPIVSEGQWLSARKKLLAHEKELTKHYDRVNAERRHLPMVKVEKNYMFKAPGGELSLKDLFEGRRQLVIYHFMFDPAWEKGCPGCTAYANTIGDLSMLSKCDTTL